MRTQLKWAPPTLTSPRAVTVTDDPATRYIVLNDGEDLQLTLPTVITDYSNFGTRDALVHVKGGRNVVAIGGHVQAAVTPTTTLGQPAGATDTEIVAATAGFPASGSLRIDGEFIYYTGTTGSSFTGCTRNAGFFNTGPTSSLTHAAGATVYVAEAARSGFYFERQTGTVHVEGLLIDGNVNDGIRVGPADGGIVQIQNSRIGPVMNAEYVNSTDGHPDCVQIIRGPDALRMDRCTLITRYGRAILNRGSDNARQAVRIDLSFIETLGTGSHGYLFSNPDVTTLWTFDGVRAQPDASCSVADDSAVGAKVTTIPAGAPAALPQFVPAGVAGIGYVSPGYL